MLNKKKASITRIFYFPCNFFNVCQKKFVFCHIFFSLISVILFTESTKQKSRKKKKICLLVDSNSSTLPRLKCPSVVTPCFLGTIRWQRPMAAAVTHPPTTAGWLAPFPERTTALASRSESMKPNKPIDRPSTQIAFALLPSALLLKSLLRLPRILHPLLQITTTTIIIFKIKTTQIKNNLMRILLLQHHHHHHRLQNLIQKLSLRREHTD